MFERPTVIVVGAGASAEADFPLGTELIRQIAELSASFDQSVLNNEGSSIYQSLMSHFKPADKAHFWSKMKASFHRIADASRWAGSIDEVVKDLADKDIQYIAKLMIASIISSIEKDNEKFSTKNGFIHNFDPIKFTETWYFSLFKILKMGTDRTSLEHFFHNVSIINFNYDRSLEQYLYNSISRYYSIDDRAVVSVLDKLEIFRPYGSIGRLPWQTGPGPSVPFGRLDHGLLSEVANNIRTIHEFEAILEDSSIMLDRIRVAERIIFLGCGFHSQNIHMLSCQARADVQVLATGYNLSQPAMDKAQRVVNQAFQRYLTTQFENRKCGPFLSDRVTELAV